MSSQLLSLIPALILMVFFLSQSLSVYLRFEFYGSEDMLITSGLGIYFFPQEILDASVLTLTQIQMHKL